MKIGQNERRKLLERVHGGYMGRWFGRVFRWLRAGKFRDYGDTLDGTRRHDYPPGQWGRWYQADQKHKRQCRALRRMGMRLPPEAWNLPRAAVD